MLCLASCLRKDLEKKEQPTFQKVNKKEAKTLPIKIPNDWVHKLQNGKVEDCCTWSYNEYAPNGQPINYVSAKKMFEDYNSFIAPDILEGDGYDYHHLSYEAHDLDRNGQKELIVLLSWGASDDKELAVLKKQDNDWYLIFRTYYNCWKCSGDFPDINIQKSLLLIERPFGSGSGVYESYMDFYRLDDNEMKHVLRFLYTSYIFGWGNPLSQETKTSFKVRSRDKIKVTYDYKFYGLWAYDQDNYDAYTKNQLLLEGKETVSYLWDASNSTFQLQPEAKLSPEQIKSMETLANDSIFIHAFDKELKQIKAEGNPKQQKMLKAYLKAARKKKQDVEQEGTGESE